MEFEKFIVAVSILIKRRFYDRLTFYLCKKNWYRKSVTADLLTCKLIN